MKKQIKDKALLVAKGFCMGSADVVPGVSGGTMAFILGIYTRLIDAIKSFDTLWLKFVLHLQFKEAISRPHFPFLIPLFAGIFAALLFFTRVISIPELLRTDPELIYGLFFGLIAGSITILLKEMKGVEFLQIACLIIGIAAGLFVFNLVPKNTPDSAWFIFLSGALAISAMILPGISGSFILLILNKYTTIFNAIGYFKFSILIPFALGCATGLILFSRVLSYLLHHFYKESVMTICGILIASFWLIWPFQDRVYAVLGRSEKLVSSTPVMPQTMDSTVLMSIGMMLLGFVVVLVISGFANRKDSQEQ